MKLSTAVFACFISSGLVSISLSVAFADEASLLTESIAGEVLVEESILIRKQTDKPIEMFDFAVVEADSSPEKNISTAEQVPQIKGPNTKYKMEKLPDKTYSSAECSESINQVVRRFTSQIKHCYERSLKLDPTLAGRVVVNVNIKEGSVLSTTISQNKTGDIDLASCMQRKIARWSFPEECSQTSSFPFVLSPKPF